MEWMFGPVVNEIIQLVKDQAEVVEEYGEMRRVKVSHLSHIRIG
jgi:hypothetical protein